MVERTGLKERGGGREGGERNPSHSAEITGSDCDSSNGTDGVRAEEEGELHMSLAGPPE